MICRILGDCVFGEPIDSEIGDLSEPSLLSQSEQKFTYVRYDMQLDKCNEMLTFPERLRTSIDDLSLMPILQRIGRDYAESSVKLAHLFPRDSLVMAD